MKAAILILAHRNPAQAARLCGTLHHPDFDLFPCIDLKSDERPFRDAIPGATFIRERVDVRWGAFSLVQAVLNGLREILASDTPYDFIIVLSGQDYPVLPMSEIAGILGENPGVQFTGGTKIVDGDLYADRYRYKYYHFGSRTLTRLSHRLSRLLGSGKRKPPMDIYKGSNWITVSGPCAKYILDYCREHPGYIRFFRHTHCADEMFFHTLIHNSPFGGDAVRSYRHYIDWSENRPSPKTLTAEDFSRIVTSGNWFARKFDTDADSAVLDLLDRYREERLKELTTRN